mgnify:CR=1 FL=1|jgi:ABC-type sugar transport system, ATPase component
MIGRPMPDAPLLVAEGLVKDYGPTRALDGASLHVYPGEVLAVIGRPAPASRPCCTASPGSSGRTPAGWATPGRT